MQIALIGSSGVIFFINSILYLTGWLQRDGRLVRALQWPERREPDHSGRLPAPDQLVQCHEPSWRRGRNQVACP